MDDIIASVSGVRGIIGKNLTPDNLNRFTSAFCSFCRNNSASNSIVIGRDGRVGGNIISNIVIANVILSGFKVIYLGVVPTPTVQIAAEKLKSAGGIVITASHNPQEWNGLKFLNGDGTFLDAKQNSELRKFADKKEFKFAKVPEFFQPYYDEKWIDLHIDLVLSSKYVSKTKIIKKKYKVVVDAVNSAGSVIVPKLLKKLGCSVIELYCDSSGIFPHTPEPIPENLKLLSRAVKKHKADIGIAVDPDSDRLVLITDTGEPFSEENTITAVINSILRKEKKHRRVTVNLSTTRAVDDVARNHNAKVFRSPVGEINVVKEMMKNKSIAGGEGSGGVIIPELHYGRDAIAGIGVILTELAESGLKLSAYKRQLPQYFISKTKITVDKNPDKILRRLKSNYSLKKFKINTADGLKIDAKDYWIHLRKSNTEPIIRIITEAKSRKESLRIQKELVEEISKYFK